MEQPQNPLLLRISCKRWELMAGNKIKKKKPHNHGRTGAENLKKDYYQLI
ncbi:hypothetical protein HYT53_04650 [Candidatus Woesearchaeota archaeon]|nr:hypothetical protein [Candidatus Woesearchaeota archaeon]